MKTSKEFIHRLVELLPLQDTSYPRQEGEKIIREITDHEQTLRATIDFLVVLLTCNKCPNRDTCNYKDFGFRCAPERCGRHHKEIIRR